MGWITVEIETSETAEERKKAEVGPLKVRKDAFVEMMASVGADLNESDGSVISDGWRNEIYRLAAEIKRRDAKTLKRKVYLLVSGRRVFRLPSLLTRS